MESNYHALAGGVSAWGLGKLGARGGFGSGGALGGALPSPPVGFLYLIGADGAFLKGADGLYLLGVAP